MRPRYCTNCGDRFEPDSRFCQNCGIQIQVAPEPESIRGTGSRASGSILDLLPGRDLPLGRNPIYTLSSRDLNFMVNCSLLNAPLDTAFLLISNQANRGWMPLDFISSMEGFTATGVGRVEYILDPRFGEFCAPHEFRSGGGYGVADFCSQVRQEIWNLRSEPSIEIMIFPVFKNTSYGAIDGEIRGKWATILDDRGIQNVQAVLQMPLSEQCLRGRLLDYGCELHNYIEHWKKEHPGQNLDHQISVLEAIKQIDTSWPQGNLDHIRCIASVVQRYKYQNTVLEEASPPPLPPAAGSEAFWGLYPRIKESPESLQSRKRVPALLDSSGLKVVRKPSEASNRNQIKKDLQSAFTTPGQ